MLNSKIFKTFTFSFLRVLIVNSEKINSKCGDPVFPKLELPRNVKEKAL